MAHEGHEWASAGPAGLTALAVACFMFFAMFNGLVGHECMLLMGIILICAGVIQLVTCILELMEGNILGGNVFLFFCMFFMMATGFEMIFKYFHVIGGGALPMDARIDGWLWMVLAITLTAWTPGYLKGAPALFFAIALVDVALFLIFLTDLGITAGAVAHPIAGWLLLIVGIIGIYLAAATVLGGVFKRPVLPVGKPLVK